MTNRAAIRRAPSPNGSPWTRDRATAATWSGTTRDELRIRRVEYYDRKDAHLKTRTVSRYAQYLGGRWWAGEMTMVNHLTGKSTVLTWTDYRFRTGLEDNDFTPTSLRRAR